MSDSQPSRSTTGLFVTIEGIDGAGKTTLIDAIEENGFLAGRRVHVIRKASRLAGGYIEHHADGLSKILWAEQTEQQRNGINDLHWLWLACAWFSLVEQFEIEPYVGSGYAVLADSWTDKILARFLLKSSLVADQANVALGTFRRPDCTIFLDVDPQIAGSRKKAFGYSESGNFDGLLGQNLANFVAYQSRVRESYVRLAKQDNWITFAEAPTPEFVSASIAKLAERL